VTVANIAVCNVLNPLGIRRRSHVATDELSIRNELASITNAFVAPNTLAESVTHLLLNALVRNEDNYY
jgi:hypothetical protein